MTQLDKEIENLQNKIKKNENEKQRLADELNDLQKKKEKEGYISQYEDTYWIYEGDFLHINKLCEYYDSKKDSIEVDAVIIHIAEKGHFAEIYKPHSLENAFFTGKRHRSYGASVREESVQTEKITKEQFNDALEKALGLVNKFRQTYEEIRDESISDETIEDIKKQRNPFLEEMKMNEIWK